MGYVKINAGDEDVNSHKVYVCAAWMDKVMYPTQICQNSRM